MNFVFVIISFPSNETAERICFFFYFVGRVCVCVFRSKTSNFFLKNVFETIREAKCKKKKINKKQNKTEPTALGCIVSGIQMKNKNN